MSSCASRAGSCIRFAKLRFISMSAGNRSAPMSASHGSTRSIWIIASTTRTITPVANGTGQKTSTAALTSASMWASSSPVGVSRWYWSARSRYRSDTWRRSVAMTRSPATPE